MFRVNDKISFFIIKKTQRTADEIAEKEGKDGRLRVERGISVTFTPHIFRHTYATNLYYAGVDVKKSQYYLGEMHYVSKI